jgi:hypothetical protein
MRVEFVSEKLLRSCWYDVIVLIIHAPTKDNIYKKDNLY